MSVERAVTAVGRVRRAGSAIVERDAETPCNFTLAYVLYYRSSMSSSRIH